MSISKNPQQTLCKYSNFGFGTACESIFPGAMLVLPENLSKQNI